MIRAISIIRANVFQSLSPHAMPLRHALVLVLLLSATSCDVSENQEVEIGAQNSAQINAQLPLVTDPEINGYVTALGKRIASHTSRANLDWRFFVVNSRDVNAFALPGGFVYVNRGLIERAQKMDQLAGALGHEIGHVVRRHSVEQMKKANGANIGVSLLCTLTSICDSRTSRVVINAAGAAWFARFSRLDEAQADSEAVANVIRAGISPDGIPQLFEILVAERKRTPDRVETFFASHPLEEDRIAHTRHEIQLLDRSQLVGLTEDERAFHVFKQELDAVTPPPAVGPGRPLPQNELRRPRQ